MEINLTIYGNPVPQGRPRFKRVGNFVKTYDPEKSKNWKESIRWQAIQQKAPMLSGALSMRLEFWLFRPKSMPKKVFYPVKKPDMDNLLKAVQDALERICYERDSQIIQVEMIKHYVPLEPMDYPITPCVKINIRELCQ